MIRRHPPRHSHTLGIATAFLAVAALCLGTACSPGVTATAGTSLEVWPWGPATMRVHPLTRFRTMPDGQARGIEARIELRDVNGYACRGVGLLTLHITSTSELRKFSRHAVDLADLATNSERFDDVTRTYIVRIDLSDQSHLPDVLVLHAQFQPPGDVGAMTDEMRIDVTP